MVVGRYIAISGNAQVENSVVPDESKPNSHITYCAFAFSKLKSTMTIPVYHYNTGGAPEEDCIIFCAGELFFPPGDSDGHIHATQFMVIVPPEPGKDLPIGPPSVWVLSAVATVLGRDWYLDVATYDHASRSTKTFQVIVTVPDNRRHEKLNAPNIGYVVAVRGVLAYLSVQEDMMAAIELEMVTFLPHPAGAPSNLSLGMADTKNFLGKGKSKRQLRSESLNIGTPLKKSKSGPIDAFTLEELGFSASSQSSSGSTSKSSGSLESSSP